MRIAMRDYDTVTSEGGRRKHPARIKKQFTQRAQVAHPYPAM